MTEWILLVPEHLTVDVRTSGAVKVPVLVTDKILQTVALAAASALSERRPIDIGALVVALARGEPLEVALIDAGHPVTVTPEVDQISWGCTCGKFWTRATGGAEALGRHQATCAVHRRATNFPADYRVDG